MWTDYVLPFLDLIWFKLLVKAIATGFIDVIAPNLVKAVYLFLFNSVVACLEKYIKAHPIWLTALPQGNCLSPICKFLRSYYMKQASRAYVLGMAAWRTNKHEYLVQDAFIDSVLHQHVAACLATCRHSK